MSQRWGAHYRVPFLAWLYQHRQQYGAIGNMARAVYADTCLRGEGRVYHVATILRHWEQCHTRITADDRAALREAWATYQREVCHEQSA